jgi:hypothetical protein
MDQERYAISEIAARIGRAAGIQDPSSLLRMIRYWANEGLMVPVGPLHTGKGRDRLFARQEILRASILFEMSKWNLTAGTMKVLMATINDEANNRAGGELLKLVDTATTNYFRFSTWGYPRTYMLLAEYRPTPSVNRSELYINAKRLRTDLGI